MKMKYEHIVTEVFRKPWAILPEKLELIAQLVALRASGERLSEEEIRARLNAASLLAGPRTTQSFGTVAVIPMRGVIARRMDLMTQISGGCSIEKLTASFRQALADQAVKAIVFDVDSPGGTVDAVPELADEIYKARSQKKIIAVANGMAASAAYWLASQASEVVVTPSGAVGSIGVFCEHEDVSEAMKKAGVSISLIHAGKYKTEGNSFEPLSDEARAELQSKVDAFYGMFVKAVARGRRTAQDDVRGGFGQGRMVLAADAVKGGMADRIATLDDVLAKLGGTSSSAGRVAAAAAPGEFRADGDPTDDECECECESCVAGACQSCTNEACDDTTCSADGCPNQARAKARASLSRRQRELNLH